MLRTSCLIGCEPRILYPTPRDSGGIELVLATNYTILHHSQICHRFIQGAERVHPVPLATSMAKIRGLSPLSEATKKKSDYTRSSDAPSFPNSRAHQVHFSTPQQPTKPPLPLRNYDNNREPLHDTRPRNYRRERRLRQNHATAVLPAANPLRSKRHLNRRHLHSHRNMDKSSHSSRTKGPTSAEICE